MTVSLADSAEIAAEQMVYWAQHGVSIEDACEALGGFRTARPGTMLWLLIGAHQEALMRLAEPARRAA